MIALNWIIKNSSPAIPSGWPGTSAMHPFFKFRIATTFFVICIAGGISFCIFHKTILPPAGNFSDANAPAKSTQKIRRQTSPPHLQTAIGGKFGNPNSASSDDELLQLARSAVACSPQEALLWARSQTDAALHGRLLSAVIRAWGEINPAAAVNWALQQGETERQSDLEMALTGAAIQPEKALAIGRKFLIEDPTDENGYAAIFVGALSNAGQFQAALEFIGDAPPDSLADWLQVTFSRWGQTRPEEAMNALDSIHDGALRAQTFQSLADGWAAADPSALATFAGSLPAGASRDYAMNKALDNWSLQDPVAMAAWLNTSPSGVNLDQAIAMLIAKTDSANGSPEVSMNWVENISDPNLKFDSMMRVLGEWMETDPPAARQYVANAQWLDEGERQDILKNLKDHSTTGAASGD